MGGVFVEGTLFGFGLRGNPKNTAHFRRTPVLCGFLGMSRRDLLELAMFPRSKRMHVFQGANCVQRDSVWIESSSRGAISTPDGERFLEDLLCLFGRSIIKQPHAYLWS